MMKQRKQVMRSLAGSQQHNGYGHGVQEPWRCAKQHLLQAQAVQDNLWSSKITVMIKRGKQLIGGAGGS